MVEGAFSDCTGGGNMANEVKSKNEPARQVTGQHPQKKNSLPAPKQGISTGDMYIYLDTACNICQVLPHSVCIMAPDGELLMVNPHMESMLGYPEGGLIGRRLTDLIGESGRKHFREYVSRVTSRQAVTLEAEMVRRDGSRFLAEVHMRLLETDENKYILSLVHDVTRYKKIEEELYRALKMESMALIAGGIASRFNALLTHILGNINVVLNEIESDTQISRLLEETDKSVESARELARQLMTFARSGSPVKKTASVNTLLKDTAEFVLSGSNVFCNFYISEGLHKADIDEGQFSQAMSNILLNASQAMPRGGIIDVRARNVKLDDNEVANLPQGEYIRISVEDHGHGIAADDLPHIFDPYFTTRQDRLGLGLSIAYSIIHRHGGGITVDSQPGKGSIFYIYLPAASGAGTESETVKKPASQGIKMLIVDDEAVVRNAGGRLLNRLGYERVEFAASGTEALDKYRQSLESGSPFEIVILDLSLPGSPGGKEVIKRLLMMDPRANIMVSGGYFNDPILSDPLRYGVKGVLAKPFKLGELKLMLQEKPEEKSVLK